MTTVSGRRSPNLRANAFLGLNFTGTVAYQYSAKAVLSRCFSLPLAKQAAAEFFRWRSSSSPVDKAHTSGTCQTVADGVSQRGAGRSFDWRVCRRRRGGARLAKIHLRQVVKVDLVLGTRGGRHVGVLYVEIDCEMGTMGPTARCHGLF